MIRCARCNKKLPEAMFSAGMLAQKPGRAQVCRPCVRNEARAARQRPSGAAWEANRQSARRSLAYGCHSDATQLDVLATMEAAAGRCHYCGRKAKLALEHVIPLARGGAHTRSNFVMACKSCNSAKQARTPEHYAATCGRLLI